MPRIVFALVIQAVVFALVVLGVYVAPYIISPPYPIWFFVLVQAGLAALITWRVGLPYWWVWIQLILPFGVYAAVSMEFESFWAFLALVIIWLFFSNVLKDRVPLYLTNSVTRQALKKLLEDRVSVRFMDLGCGLGGNVVFMSQMPQVLESHGVETAPIPYLLSKISTLLQGGKVYALDLWKADLSQYDVVYAFLSPEPMAALWRKVQAEMRSGSIFVSNSFYVPEAGVSEVWELADSRQTKLYIYRIE